MSRDFNEIPRVFHNCWNKAAAFQMGRARGDLDEEEQWFQKDVVSPHIANVQRSMKSLGSVSVSCKAKVEWGPHSPDLNHPRYLPLRVPQ